MPVGYSRGEVGDTLSSWNAAVIAGKRGLRGSVCGSVFCADFVVSGKRREFGRRAQRARRAVDPAFPRVSGRVGGNRTDGRFIAGTRRGLSGGGRGKLPRDMAASLRQRRADELRQFYASGAMAQYRVGVTGHLQSRGGLRLRASGGRSGGRRRSLVDETVVLEPLLPRCICGERAARAAAATDILRGVSPVPSRSCCVCCRRTRDWWCGACGWRSSRECCGEWGRRACRWRRGGGRDGGKVDGGGGGVVRRAGDHRGGESAHSDSV